MDKEFDIYIKEFKEGNTNNFNFFYEETKKAIFYNILSFVKNRDIAEDLLQDTYVKFLLNVKRIKNSTSILGYLMQISKNISLDYLKKKKEYQYEEKDINIHNDQKEIDKAIILDKVRKFLKEDEYNILLYHLLDEMKFEAIAKEFNMPLGTVLYKYNKTLEKIRKELAL